MDQQNTRYHARLWDETPPEERRELLEEADTNLGIHDSLASAPWWPADGFARAWTNTPFDEIPPAVQSALAVALVPKLH
jgi:hypothetical protein